MQHLFVMETVSGANDNNTPSHRDLHTQAQPYTTPPSRQAEDITPDEERAAFQFTGSLHGVHCSLHTEKGMTVIVLLT